MKASELLLVALSVLCVTTWAAPTASTTASTTASSSPSFIPPSPSHVNTPSVQFTHSPTASRRLTPPPTTSPRPTPSVTHTPFPSVGGFYNHSGHITMVIDDFTTGTWQRVAWHTEDGIPRLTSNFQASAPCGETILGCSRSMKLLVNTNLTASDYEGGLALIYPHVYYRVPGSCWFLPVYHNESMLTLQYDGDDDPNTLNMQGLGGVDFTANGRSQAIVFSVIAGYGAVRTIDVELFDINGKKCGARMAETSMDCHHFVPQAIFFHQLTGNCDLKNIGAFQLNLVAVGEDGSLALSRIQLVDTVDPDWISGARC